MDAPAELLDTLCELRRITYVRAGPDWIIRDLGGSNGAWPELVVGHDLRHILSELQAWEQDVTVRLDTHQRFVLRWIERPSPNNRTRYYELIVHRANHGDDWIFWLIDRSAYGRLKMRIDRYYNELVDSNRSAAPTHDRRAGLDSDVTP